MSGAVEETGGAVEKAAATIEEMIGGAGPADPQLADAYRALWRNADPDTHRLDAEVAETIAAEATKVRSKVVRNSILKPLETRGYLRPEWGTLVIYPPNKAPVFD